MMARSRWLFVPRTLDYLRRGGRIGAAAHLAGSILDIRPVLTARDGAAAVVRVTRSMRRAVDAIVDLFAADVASLGLGGAVVHHIADEGAGEALARRLRPIAGMDVPVLPIGPVIGLHVGPGAVGVVYHTIEPRP